MGKKRKGPGGGEALRAQLYNLMRAAQEGKAGAAWFRQLALRAGFVSVADGKGGKAVALVSAVALQVGFGISERTLRRWVAEGMPVFEPGLGNKPSTFDLFAVMKWRDEKREREKPKEDAGRNEAAERLTLARAKAIERENALAEGELCYRRGISDQATVITSRFRAEMDAVLRVAGPELVKMINAAIDRWDQGLQDLGSRPRAVTG